VTARRATENASDPSVGRWARDPDELPIVLSGGPADGHWYWRDDFEHQQFAARRMAAVHHRAPLDPASWPLLYAPSSSVVTHDRDPQKQATRWVWTGPAEVHTLHDLARLNAEAFTNPSAVPATRPVA
jgi:hypothetical protein